MVALVMPRALLASKLLIVNELSLGISLECRLFAPEVVTDHAGCIGKSIAAQSSGECLIRTVLIARWLRKLGASWHELSAFGGMENNTLSKTREALVNDVDKLKHDAVQVAQDVKNHANAHVDFTKQRVNQTIDSVRESMTSHPLTLLGIGFAFGFLFGFRTGR